ncbi:MAG: RluA family pseudouridine synthase [Microthrixaceae bacterium]|nr:RluA family pseudouridine synthase [Microthrixaceae bacterium]MCB1010856.1 RluA family pseudouridine synthase [Microthrixaceae bacterium]MCO5321431.1 RluA family pseudouridine synthase [Microthrixaceae bacterium]
MGDFNAAEVPPVGDGERLDRYVAMVFDCSRSEASASVRAGQVTVDGSVVTKPSTRLDAGQSVVVAEDPHTEPEGVAPDPSVSLKVLYEDSDLVVIDKPVGLVVHPGAGNPSGTVCNGLVQLYPEMLEVGEPHRPGIVHRLDRATSGLMVAARSDRAYRSLVDQLASHEVERVYTAVVLGDPGAERGVVDAPIGRSKRNPLRMTVAEGARPARTHFEVQRRFDDPVSALLTCRLETGRTHQIRVHMHSIGNPVLGDELYGGRRSGSELDRMFLHASELVLSHPADGRVMRFSSPLPEDLANWLATHSG